MAVVQTNVSEKVYSVKRWLGVNEAEEGDATLKIGEAAVCRNFKITGGGALRKRGGTKREMRLTTAYNLEESRDTVAHVEYGASTFEFEAFPRVAVDDEGAIALEGEAVTVNLENAEAHRGYYTSEADVFERFLGTTYTPRRYAGPETTRYEGESVPTPASQIQWCWFCLYDAIMFNSTTGEYETEGATVECIRANPSDFDGKYTLLDALGRPANIFATDADKPTVADLTALAVTPRPARGFARLSPGYRQEGEDWYVTTHPEAGTDMDRIYRGTLIAHSVANEQSWSWEFAPLYTTDNTTPPEVKALWSGVVMGREVICAAGNGNLWELALTGGVWEKASCGLINTDDTVHLFGFDEKLYILNGSEYKVWDGTILADVEGYRPLVAVSVPPEGGGTTLEQVNKLTGARRAWFSPDGTATVFRLPEKEIASLDYIKDATTGKEYSGAYTADLEAGTVTFDDVPEKGTNTLEIAWTFPTDHADAVRKMRFSELYNGSQDTRVFIYGDGSNRCFYSGLDHNGRGRADYFPDLNECAPGAANTPITAMIRNYGQLLCFKLDSTWGVTYGTIVLEDGSTTAGFYVVPVNRDMGSCAMGEAVVVENRPRTLDGRSVIEWKPNAYGSITSSETNALRVSDRVGRTIRTFDLAAARTFYDKINHEYYVIGSDGTALVNNIEADAWYVYTGFGARCVISYKDELYFGTADGWLVHFSEDYTSDNGAPIDAEWQSGAMDFGEDFRRKYSAMLWVGIKPEERGYLQISAMTDRKTDFAEYPIEAEDDAAMPQMKRVKLKAKKFTYYKLLLSNNTADTTALVVSADIRVRGTGYVR